MRPTRLHSRYMLKKLKDPTTSTLICLLFENEFIISFGDHFVLGSAFTMPWSGA